jgi:hypothetical protein
MGEPSYLSAVDVERLKAVSVLVKEPIGWTYEAGAIRFEVALPAHSVAAITMEWPAAVPFDGGTQ